MHPTDYAFRDSRRPVRTLICVLLAVAVSVGVFSACGRAQGNPKVTVFAGPFDNPRGMVVGPDGYIYLALGGRGDIKVGGSASLQPDLQVEAPLTGGVVRLKDANVDGDATDGGEMNVVLTGLPSSNLVAGGAARDQVQGPGDVEFVGGELVVALAFIDPGTGFVGDRLLRVSDGGATALFAAEARGAPDIAGGSGFGNPNFMAAAPGRSSLFISRSAFNDVIELRSDASSARIVTKFDLLGGAIEAVPVGLAFDRARGHLLVALFTGEPFLPGMAQVVRIDLATGKRLGEIERLTMAIDVAVGEDGDVYVVQMADAWNPADGEYRRLSGSVTRFGAGGKEKSRVGGLDLPTNLLLLRDGSLLVSTGQGTPGGGDPPRVGRVLRITGL